MTTQELTNTQLFRGISPEELESLLDCLSAGTRQYHKGDRILAEGEPTDRMGIVLSGMVLVEYCDIFGNRSILGSAASGAVFGVVGGLMWAVIRNRGRLEDLSLQQLVIMLLLSVYLGLSEGGVDNAAHIGGVISGFLLAIPLYRPAISRNPYSHLWGDD